MGSGAKIVLTMPIHLQRNAQFHSTGEAARTLFAEGILAFLRKNPDKAYTPTEIAKGLRI